MSVEQLSEVRARINQLKDAGGKTWREIAAMDEFNGLSHATIRDIANGGNPSRETCKVLGVRKTEVHVVAFHLHDEQTAQKLRALLARYGTRREVAAALVSGELKIVKNGE